MNRSPHFKKWLIPRHADGHTRCIEPGCSRFSDGGLCLECETVAPKARSLRREFIEALGYEVEDEPAPSLRHSVTRVSH